MIGNVALSPGSDVFLTWNFIEPLAKMYKSNIEDLKIEVCNMERWLTRKMVGNRPHGLTEFSFFACQLRGIL